MVARRSTPPARPARTQPEELLETLLLRPLRAAASPPRAALVVLDAVQRLRCGPTLLDDYIGDLIKAQDEPGAPAADRAARQAALLQRLVEGTPQWVRFVLTTEREEQDLYIEAAALRRVAR